MLKSSMFHKGIALGLLVFCLVALGLGLFNAVQVQQPQTPAPTGEEDSFSAFFQPAIHSDRLLLVNINGPIMMTEEEGFFSSDSNAVVALESLTKALEDHSVKGVLLRINSPGGTVGMSQELHGMVERLRELKPVVASFGDVAASGGYYMACAADKIVANPGTLTGSIGVIIATLNFKGLMQDKLGVKSYTIKSGRFKDLLNPYRDATHEELALVQQIIDESYEQFLTAVITGRTRFVQNNPLEKEALIARIKAIADGRVLIGKQAKSAGLVDEIGGLDEAYTLLDRMAKERFNLKTTKRLPLKSYSEAANLWEFLGLTSATTATFPQINTSAAEGMATLVPFSLKHPNQPLWIME